MKNIAVFASHGGSNLQAIIDACSNQTLDAKVCVVISNNGEAFALQRAKNANIPNYHYSIKTVGSEKELNEKIYKVLLDNHTDIIVLAGYMKKLSTEVLQNYKDKIFNIHPALLPKYGGKGMYGKFVHEAVINAKEKVTGVTIHKVNEEYDSGEIVAQTKVPVLEDDTPETLAARVLDQEHIFLVETLRSIVSK